MLTRLEKDIQNYHTDLWKKYDYINLNKSPISRKFLGVPIPLLRSFKKWEKFSFDEIFYLYTNTKTNEIQTWSLIQLEKKSIDELSEKKEQMQQMIDYCDNWWISDSLSSFYAKILEKNQNFLTILSSWNKHSNFWKRRQSVVSLFYYSSLRKKHQKFDSSIDLVKNLLYDKEYYVQKWVGWTLRELYNVYPEKTKKFLEKNICQIHAHAWQASTEKLEPDFKTYLKEKRKQWI